MNSTVAYTKTTNEHLNNNYKQILTYTKVCMTYAQLKLLLSIYVLNKYV